MRQMKVNCAFNVCSSLDPTEVVTVARSDAHFALSQSVDDILIDDFRLLTGMEKFIENILRTN